MITKERLDMVSICTPPWLHAEQAIAALEARVHVLVEKPMAMTESECKAMCAAARATGSTLGVVHNFLFSRSVKKARERIAQGRAGRVQSVLAFQMSTPRRRLPDWYDALPGQLFFDEVPHLAYLSRALLGPDEPAVVYAHAVESPDEAVQRTQNVVAVLRSSTRSGILAMNFNASRAEWGVVVVGTKESYIIDLFRDQLLVMGLGGPHTPGEVLGQTLSGLAQMTTGALVSGALYATKRLLYGHEEVILGFVNAVRHGTPPLVQGEEGVRTIGLVERICKMAGLKPVLR